MDSESRERRSRFALFLADHTHLFLIAAVGGLIHLVPEWYADRFGWEEMAASVAKVYRGPPDEEKPYTAIAAANYGEAGAMELFASRYRLPRVYSPHNNYHLLGTA